MNENAQGTEPAERAWPKYRSHKEVHGLKLAKVEPDPVAVNHTRFTPADDRYPPVVFPNYAEAVKRCNAAVTGDPGYLVAYEDGFMSWSPTKAFEGGYTEIG